MIPNPVAIWNEAPSAARVLSFMSLVLDGDGFYRIYPSPTVATAGFETASTTTIVPGSVAAQRIVRNASGKTIILP